MTEIIDITSEEATVTVETVEVTPDDVMETQTEMLEEQVEVVQAETIEAEIEIVLEETLEKPDFKAAATPTIYRHQNRDHYFDQWQKRFVPINDFQALKQYIGVYLETVLEVPVAMMQSTMPFRAYRIPSERVGDFVVEYYRQGKLKPLIFVKCSSQDSGLTPSLIAKANEAGMELGTRYTLLTNGTDVYFSQLNQLGTEYEAVNLKVYSELVPEKAGEQVLAKPFVRQTLEELSDILGLRKKDLAEDWYLLGTSHKDINVPITVNLAEAYLDKTVLFSPQTHASMTLVQDLGLRELRSSQIQGMAPSGIYRALLVRDSDGNYQIASFIITAGEEGPKQGTSLFVLFDDERTTYQVLQIDMSRNATYDEASNYYHLWHNGRLAKRRDDRTITEQLLESIQAQSPDLLVDGKITFTAVETTDIIDASHTTFTTMTMKLLNYSNIRNQYLIV